MKITYDAEADMLAIDLDADESRRSGGRRLEFGGAYADIAADGTILALEIDRASERYAGGALERLMPTGEPMSLAEAAKRTGLTQVTLRRACEEGRLGGRKIGRNWTVTAEALARYLPEVRQRRQTAAAG